MALRRFRAEITRGAEGRCLLYFRSDTDIDQGMVRPQFGPMFLAMTHRKSSTSINELSAVPQWSKDQRL